MLSHSFACCLAKGDFCHLFQVSIKTIACLKFLMVNNGVGLSQAVMAELFGMMDDRTSQGLCQGCTIVQGLSPLQCGHGRSDLCVWIDVN